MAARSKSARPPREDPGTTARRWCARFAAGSPPPLLVLAPPTSGEAEPWFAARVAAAAREAARADEGLELGAFDGASPDFDVETLDGFLGAGSLFASRRALVLTRAGKAFERWPRLAEAVAAAVGEGGGLEWAVVACDRKAPAAALKTLGRRAQEVGGELVRFRALYPDPPPWRPDPDASEAARFVADEARERGLRLGPGVAGLLVAVAGARPGDLVQALDHFGMLGLERVEEDHVRDTVSHSAEGQSFAFTEAVLTGDSAEVLRILRRMERQGLRSFDGRRLAPREAFHLLLAGLVREHGRTEAVRAALEDGADLDEAFAAAGVRTVPARRRMESRLTVCDRERLDALADALLEAERRVKREGWRDPLHVLEALALTAFVRPR